MAYEITFAAGSSGSWPENYERYVHVSAGDDSNDGLSPATPMATIQAAYDDLETTADAAFDQGSGTLPVGQINLSSGEHDVGTGLVITRNHPVKIKGKRGGVLPGQYVMPTASIILSSGTPTQLITYGDATDQSFGFEMEDVMLSLTSDQDCGLKLISVNHPRVERCGFFSATGDSLDAYAIIADNDDGGDGSWGQILNCGAQQMGLFKTDTTGQFNYWRIHNNHITIGTVNEAGLYLNCSQFVRSADVRFNHFESSPTDAAGPAIYVRNGNACVFDNNYGECSDPDYPFYDFGGVKCMILGGFCLLSPSGTGGLFVQTTTGADNNLFLIPGLRHPSDSTSTTQKDRYLDQNTNSKNLWYGDEWTNNQKRWIDLWHRTAPANPPSQYRRLFADSATSSAASVRTSGGTTTSLEA